MRLLSASIVFALVTVGCSGPVPSKNGDDEPIISNNTVCGNGVTEDNEACDGEDLSGTTCQDLGLGPGELNCRTNCSSYDRSSCGAPDSCGDGVVDDVETCDGDELGGTTCESLGFGPGTLSCTANCAEFDTSGCGALATCGNGNVDDQEVCDGSALNAATCETLGLGTGSLACASNCQQYDTTGCSNGCTPDCSATECGPDPVCGTDCGGCSAGEQCTMGGACECVPTTCAAEGAQCGQIDDGCGGMLECGGCPGAQTCGIDAPNMCGCDAVPNGGTLNVDVPVVDITFELTVGGQPLTLTNTTASDEGGLVLVDPDTGERIVLPDAYNAGALTYPQTRRVIPGTYDIYYYNDGAESFWPINENNLLTCFSTP